MKIFKKIAAIIVGIELITMPGMIIPYQCDGLSLLNSFFIVNIAVWGFIIYLLIIFFIVMYIQEG